MKTVWTPLGSDRSFVTHHESACKGRPCCVHNPSNHHMRNWPQHYRMDTGVTERICPHGVGHPDPDQPWPKDDARWLHGCDGCCSSPDPARTPIGHILVAGAKVDLTESEALMVYAKTALMLKLPYDKVTYEARIGMTKFLESQSHKDL